MNKFILLLSGLLLMFAGCANNYKYFGNSYAPTQNAKIYFREGDIDKPYEIMGKMYASFKTDTKDSKVQKKIMDAVKSHGGDGAVFSEMATRSTGSVSTSGGGATRVGKKSSVGGGVSKTKDTEEDQLEIIVIKYKSQASE